MPVVETLSVLIGGRHAAEVSRSADQPGLIYSDNYIASKGVPLSVAMPKTGGRFPLPRVSAWMDGLLSDNPTVVEQQRRLFGAQGKSSFDLLASPMGMDCAGAVQFCQPAQAAAATGRGGGVKWLSDQDLALIVSSLALANSTWQGGRTSGQFSLAGAQAKTALQLHNGRWGLPWGNEPTTHIIKPAIAQLKDQALNEHICMEAAGRIGLRAASTRVTEIGGVQCVVVTRYDRIMQADGTHRRVHQEDMCQALGIPPTKKYQSDGGPTPKDIGTLIRQHCTNPDRDVEAFRDALIFNWVIAGTDAHAKNYGFILEGNAVALAPLYDIASWLPYEADKASLPKAKLAMKMGRDYTLRKSDRKSAWVKTGETLGLDGDETVFRAEEIASQVPAALGQAAESVPAGFSGSEVVDMLLDRVDSRARVCSRVSAAVGVPRDAPRSLADHTLQENSVVNLLEPSPHEALEPTGLDEFEICGKTVKQTNKPCLLAPSHRGRCRSVLRS